MGLFLPILASSIFALSGWFVYDVIASFKSTTYEMQEYKDADKVLAKAKKLENLSDIETTYERKINKNTLSSVKMLKHKPFAVVVSDTKGIRDEEINNYAEAAKVVMNQFPNADDSFFTCTRLEATGKISLESCQNIQTQSPTVYKMNKGNLQYSLNSEIAQKADTILNNREFNIEKTLTTDGNTTTTSKKMVSSDKAFKKEMLRIYKLEQKAERYIEEGRYLLASQILTDVDEANIQSPNTAQLRVTIIKKYLESLGEATYSDLNGTKIFNIAEQDFTKISTDIKESIIKSIAKTGDTGIKSYSNNESAKFMLNKIKEEVSTNSLLFPNITTSQKEAFLDIMLEI